MVDNNNSMDGGMIPAATILGGIGMKNLANCTPTEFLHQVMKLRTPFIEWVDKIGAAELRKRIPDGFDDMSDEEKLRALRDQGIANIGDILCAALEKDYDGTIEIMCLSCFTDVNDMDSRPMVEYIGAIVEMMNNSEVRNFFTFYMHPARKNFLKV